MSHESTEKHPPDAGQHPARHRGAREPGPIHRRFHANPALSLTTKIVVTTVGTLVILTGLVMMVAPGPGIVAIVLGLAILATEYEWAHRWLVKARQKAHEARLKAERMDPKVRRRRLLIAGVLLVVVAVGVAAYVRVYDWPTFAEDGWDWLQSLAGWVPELPGM